MTVSEVEGFLEQFHFKTKIYDILFRDDRNKNQETLEELEISPVYRKVVIESLKADDYIEGPLIDELYNIKMKCGFSEKMSRGAKYILKFQWGWKTAKQYVCHFIWQNTR